MKDRKRTYIDTIPLKLRERLENSPLSSRFDIGEKEYSLRNSANQWIGKADLSLSSRNDSRFVFIEIDIQGNPIQNAVKYLHYIKDNKPDESIIVIHFFSPSYDSAETKPSGKRFRQPIGKKLNALFIGHMINEIAEGKYRYVPKDLKNFYKLDWDEFKALTEKEVNDLVERMVQFLEIELLPEGNSYSRN